MLPAVVDDLVVHFLSREAEHLIIARAEFSRHRSFREIVGKSAYVP